MRSKGSLLTDDGLSAPPNSPDPTVVLSTLIPALIEQSLHCRRTFWYWNPSSSSSSSTPPCLSTCSSGFFGGEEEESLLLAVIGVAVVVVAAAASGGARPTLICSSQFKQQCGGNANLHTSIVVIAANGEYLLVCQ